MTNEEKTPSESRRENVEERSRIAKDALTKVKQRIDVDATKLGSTDNGYLIAIHLKTLADKCDKALNNAVTDERSRITTDTLFEVKHELEHAATDWEGPVNGYPPAVRLYKTLAKNCDKEWYDAIASERGTGVEVSQAAIPERLSSLGNEPEYFSSMGSNVKAEVIEKPEYQTPLMVIMYATIKRYYGENYDPNDRDSWTKQTDVIGWIRKKYSLSEAKAKAIEKMTRPDKSIYPQG
jgi:hypothetical protein